jgi:hypothetical protein
MSWIVTSVGRPSAVKAALVSQFEQSKRNVAHYEPELKSVELAEQLVNAELDHSVAVGAKAVTVSASGSASKGSETYPGTNQLSVSVQPIYNFQE